MPTHWTYKQIDPGDDLSQGDIIARTSSVLAVLEQVHSYFKDEKYLCFIVLTQSCDLVVRGGACKARQIGLGVVRSLDDVLPDFFAELGGTGAPGVFSEEARSDARQFLERVLNQNEQAHGLFYLHPDADVGIAVPAVALVRVSISLRSREHYQTLKASRRGGLDTEFRNKLGWLTGNLYSRVDTTDWADHQGGKAKFDSLIGDLLDGTKATERYVWVPEPWLRAGRANGIDIASIPRDRVRATLEEVAPPPPLKTALDQVRTRVGQVLSDLSDRQLRRLIELVEADEVSLVLAAQDALSAVREVLDVNGGDLLPILDRAPGYNGWTDSFVTQVMEAVERLKARQGPRAVAPLLEILRDTRLFNGMAIQFICEIVEGAVGQLVAEQKAALIERLQAVKMTPRVITRLHGLIRETGDEVLAEKLSRRLQNDSLFTSALKRQ